MTHNLGDLPTEGVHPDVRDLDLLSPLDFVLAMNRADHQVLSAVRDAAEPIASAVESVTERIAAGGRLIYFGAGTSGRIAMLDAAECPPTFGVPPDLVQARLAGGPEAFERSREGVEDSHDDGAEDVRLLGVSARDAVVGLAASGRTPYVVGALREARSRGALTVAVVCARGGPVAAEADIAIELDTGPEVLAGSTRLKAGTAQKMVLNMLSTGVMARLGRVYDNLMVDVRATNEKLRDRARRIVESVAGVGEAAAADALRACDGEAKTACAMAALGLGPAEARRRLEAAGGRLRAVLERGGGSGATPTAR